MKKGKFINNKFNNNKISSFTNGRLNIENNIKDIKFLNESIQQCNNSLKEKIVFDFEEEENLNKSIDYIKNFGIFKENKYSLKHSKIIKRDMEKIHKSLIKFELIFKMSEKGSNCETYANFSYNDLYNKNLELKGEKGECDSFETEVLEVFKVIYNI